jgi:hypothetical protein
MYSANNLKNALATVFEIIHKKVHDKFERVCIF